RAHAVQVALADRLVDGGSVHDGHSVPFLRSWQALRSAARALRLGDLGLQDLERRWDAAVLAQVLLGLLHERPHLLQIPIDDGLPQGRPIQRYDSHLLFPSLVIVHAKAVRARAALPWRFPS